MLSGYEANSNVCSFRYNKTGKENHRCTRVQYLCLVYLELYTMMKSIVWVESGNCVGDCVWTFNKIPFVLTGNYGEWNKLNLKKVWIAKDLSNWWNIWKYAFFEMIENEFRYILLTGYAIGCIFCNKNEISFYCICKSMWFFEIEMFPIFRPMQYVKSNVEHWFNHQIYICRTILDLLTYSIFPFFDGNFFRLVTFAKLHTWIFNATTINELNRKQNKILFDIR